MESTVNERIKRVQEESGLTLTAFSRKIGIAQSSLRDCIVNNAEPKYGTLYKIIKAEPRVSPRWLLTGEKEETAISIPENGIPYYEDLLVSAGKNELVPANEQPSGYINLPAVAGKYCFPVIGCSMEPEIHAGEIVVADDLCSWDRIDPDKVYLIITHEDRMIKHLEVDQEDDSILWCVSPNYKRFYINKNDIKRIFKIAFHGRLI